MSVCQSVHPPSVCPFVGLSMTFVYCIQTGEDILKLLSRPRSTSFLTPKAGTPDSKAAQNIRGWENLRFSTDIAVYRGNGIGPWLLWNVNRKSQVADRSISVPMTLSDLERREARSQSFSESI